MSGKYWGSFASLEDVRREFEISEGEDFPGEDAILFASYNAEPYAGDALVLFLDGDRLMEVRAGHCSCDGLEGSWAPMPVTWEAIAMRPRETGYGHFHDHGDADAEPTFWAMVDLAQTEGRDIQ